MAPRWGAATIWAMAAVLAGAAPRGGPIRAGAPAVQKEELVQSTYPPARRSSQVDDYHGTRVADPYRWLEDLDSPETRRWVEAENELTFGRLEGIPERPRIRKRLEELWNYERFGLPQQRGGRYFYTRNDGLQNQSVLYAADSLDGQPRVLLDPNRLSEEGVVALSGWRPSEEGRHLAYGLAAAGSDWQEWRVLDAANGRVLPDRLQWIKFSGVSWTPDGEGFYYSRYDEPKPDEKYTGANYYQKLYYHRLGDPQAQDRLIYERKDEKQWGFDGEVTEDGRYLTVGVWRGTEQKNQIFYQDLQTPGSAMVELIRGFDAQYEFLGNDGPVFWILTDLDAPRRRVIAVDTTRPDRKRWREVIPEAESVLRGVHVVGDRFLATYLQDARSVVRVFALSGRLERTIPLPAIGAAVGFGGRRRDAETFYQFSNFTTPGTIYRYDLKTGESSVFRRPQVKFDPESYVTTQVFFRSRDGTRVPMFVTRRKDLSLDRPKPTLLYAYGGFNIPITPGFSVSNLAWLEAGGVYASANLRGGGEYGRPWHEAGMLANKQNVFDDFAAAARWLIDQGYASPETLAVRGRSNGGLLIGAAMTQHPDLFAVALPGVGVMDMLRYHRFTIGWAWVSEYGSSEDPDQFATLYAYSPLHNIRRGTEYPATLITTADHDDRVVPCHSFKFAAALQAAQAGPAPVLIRIETSAGHGAGTPTSKKIDEEADALAFAASILGGPF